MSNKVMAQEQEFFKENERLGCPCFYIGGSKINWLCNVIDHLKNTQKMV